MTFRTAIIIAATATSLHALPAAAQSYVSQTTPNMGGGIDAVMGHGNEAAARALTLQHRLGDVRADLDKMRRMGAMDEDDAYRFDRRAEKLQHRLYFMAQHGYQRSDMRTVLKRFSALRGDVRDALYNEEFWGGLGYGYVGEDRYAAQYERWARGNWHRADRVERAADEHERLERRIPQTPQARSITTG